MWYLEDKEQDWEMAVRVGKEQPQARCQDQLAMQNWVSCEGGMAWW